MKLHSRELRVAQVLPNFAERDAIGNNVLLWCDALTALGVESSVFAESVGGSLAAIARPVAALRDWKPSHVLYHYSTYSQLADRIGALSNVTKVLIYHNITPAEYFRGISDVHYEYCRRGRAGLGACRSRFHLALADSEFNASELRANGFTNVVVLPLALRAPVGSLRAEGKSRWATGLRDQALNMVYVGRICPNKKITDLVMALHYIQRLARRDVRLVMVGGWEGFDGYKAFVDTLIDELSVSDAYFVGSVEDMERDAIYHEGSIFVTASEHEGFCVPIVEAWSAGLPVVAVRGSAVTETVGDAGLLVPPGRPAHLAEAVLHVTEHPEVRQLLQARGFARSEEFGAGAFVSRAAKIVGAWT